MSQSEKAPVHALKSHVPPAVHDAPVAFLSVTVQTVHPPPQCVVSQPCSQPFVRTMSQSEKLPAHEP